MIGRGKWQGMLTIVRFNGPFYMLSAGIFLALLITSFLLSPPLSWLPAAAACGAGYFLLVSLGVSHQVYDRSDLYRFRWLERALSGAGRATAVISHTGFEETSEILRVKFPETRWTVLDHHDPARMTEPSIRRARQAYPPGPETIAAAFDRWPLHCGSADLILGLLAIHEFREESERAAWFAEAKRCLKPGGRIILAEHLRDLPNFIAFGPGFLHFHSRATWRRSWEAAGLDLRHELPVTPWVRVFILSA